MGEDFNIVEWVLAKLDQKQLLAGLQLTNGKHLVHGQCVPERVKENYSCSRKPKGYRVQRKNNTKHMTAVEN